MENRTLERFKNFGVGLLVWLAFGVGFILLIYAFPYSWYVLLGLLGLIAVYAIGKIVRNDF